MDRRTLVEEVLVVLSLSLLASAVFAVIDLLSAPLRGVTVASVDQSTELARQLAGAVFGLAPVYLVLHLVRRSGEGVETIGLGWDRPRPDLARGLVLFAIVGAGGIGIYLGAVALGVNRFVVPVPPKMKAIPYRRNADANAPRRKYFIADSCARASLRGKYRRM